MEIDRKEAGDAAEMAALEYLRERGLRLITRNYRCKMGEIDLIMLDGPILALIEVRARSSLDFGGAAASVGYRKQRRLIQAFRHLLMTRADLRKLRARFDVVAFEQPGNGRPRIEWLKDAFRDSR
jgi:putative endonuclease